MGINTTRYKITAFVHRRVFRWHRRAGFTGTSSNDLNTPTGFNFMKSFDIVVMVILGGMGNTTGVVHRGGAAHHPA